MSEDSTQLSVAELLARNGQGVPASGGGRRRRGGRGIAVTDLTGDLPEVRPGSSSHAAPEEEPEQLPDFQLATPGYESESPLSGPISFYDPLAAGTEAPGTPSWEQPNSFQPSSFDSAPDAGGYRPEPSFGGYGSAPVSDPYGAAPAPSWQAAPESAPSPFGADPAPAPSGRRARRELREALAEREAADSFAASEEPVDSGRPGRRHRPEPNEQNTMVVPPFAPQPEAGPTTWAPQRAPERGHREFGAPEPREFGAPDFPPPGRNGAPGWNGAEAPRGLPAWSARRRPGAPAPAPAPPPQDFHEPDFARSDFAEPDFNQPEFDEHADHRDAGPVEDRSAGWSLSGRDPQLLSGQTVAGDLLRDANARGGEKRRGRGPRRGVIDLLDPAEAATEFYAPVEPEDEFDEDLDDELLDDEEQEQPSRWKRPAKLRMPAVPSFAFRGSTEDVNRRQWMILAGQAIGASVAGMLLFKGFEQMWDIMPFVALILAMVVILGLVALVRVLRRTDDILSTVIAVVVGIFVTLGPLAFLLSTN
ncbi:hypothetical protein [Nocardia spumae]|uniref:hypothetical protein n=1 Tax=Nocardia spumae TaxID=2887190 RepID=UPI001D1387EC|nr:hypothetical protein [Nocardia spumae]